MIFTKHPIDFWHKKKSIILTHTVYYCLLPQICATGDWFCDPGSHMFELVVLMLDIR